MSMATTQSVAIITEQEILATHVKTYIVMLISQPALQPK